MADTDAPSPAEPKYLREARFLLETIYSYFKKSSGTGHVDRQDILKLIRAKHEAFKDGCMGFESMLLDIVKDLDETTREKGQESQSEFFEEFHLVVRCFERYDHAQSAIGMIAFTENTSLTEVMLRNFLKVKQEFDKYEPGFFNELFVDELLANEYLSYYGKRKLTALAAGLEDVFDRFTIYKMLDEIKLLADEERLYRKAYTVIKLDLQEKYRSLLDGNADPKELKLHIAKLLEDNKVWSVPEELIQKIVLDLRKESFYVHNILPALKDGLGPELRDDFIRNSGLEKSYIESLEDEFLSDEEKEKIGLGGGERI